ncbi:MAG: fibronectin type III domain-containing protein, partial [Alphaproteobacteria bacterium]|nr:fibronectin type III domain-containing protein [Alphaproteobacteria bacterium]
MSKLYSSTLGWAFVVLSACALFSLPHQVSAASITWDGGGDGTTWQSANNWSGNAVPTDSDDVMISANAVTGDGTLDFSSLTVTSTGSLTITGTMSGGSLTIGSGGTVTQKNGNLQTLSGNLDIKSGGALTHFANSNAKSYYINFSAANITIDVGGSMNAVSKGYADGFGPGVGGYGSSYGGGGGAHVGDGGWGWGNGAGTPGTAGYCDLANPSTLGSAGGGGNYSGGVPGGGLIILNVSGTLTINGAITAAGSAASNPGGGAGGAINVTAGTIAGTPSSFSAAGGTATSNGGGGGGGCVLLAYTSANSIAATQVDVSGGDGYNTDGGSGAVMIKQAAQSGDVYLKNRATGGGLSRLTSVPAMKSLTISGYSTYLVSQSQTFTVGTTTIGGDGTGALSINGTLSAPSFGTLENLTLKINAGGIFDNAAAFEVKAGSSLYVYATSTVSNAFSLATSGTLYLSRWASWAGITDLVLSGGTTTLVDYTTATALTVDTLTINGNASLTNEVNSASQAHVVNISADTITIRKNGIINVKGRGYGAGVGPGAGGYAGSYGGGGGAHVGNGGLGWGAGAGAPGTGGYCNLTNPQTMGSGGGLGAYQDGSPGGGLVILSVSGVFTIDGSINASGKESTSPGAGGGGAINVTAGSISGTPILFSAAGGNASSDGGGGGGGCIRINYATTNSITAGMSNVTGGHGYNTNGGVGSFSSNKTVNILAPSSPVLGTPTNSSIPLSWTSGGGTETVFRLDQSVSGGEYTQVTSVSSATTTYSFTSLSPNLQYVFRVAAGDGVNATSSYVTSSAIFTLANAALAPTLGTPATSTVSLTINENSNPATVQYAIYDLTDAKYFASAGLETATPTFFPATSWIGSVKDLP